MRPGRSFVAVPEWYEEGNARSSYEFCTGALTIGRGYKPVGEGAQRGRLTRGQSRTQSAWQDTVRCEGRACHSRHPSFRGLRSSMWKRASGLRPCTEVSVRPARRSAFHNRELLSSAPACKSVSASTCKRVSATACKRVSAAQDMVARGTRRRTSRACVAGGVWWRA